MPGRDLPPESTDHADPSTAPEDPPFWRFSLALYAAPGVADACLELQERRGADVNLLLWALYAGAAGHGRLEASDLDRAAAAVLPWAESVVRPMRRIRRALKAPLGILDPADSAALRERIAAIEIEAERLQQRALARLLPSRPSAAPADDTSKNLMLFLDRLADPDAARDGEAAQLLIREALKTVDDHDLR